MIEAAEELGTRVGVSQACRALRVPRSSLYWDRKPKEGPAPRPTPPRALSPEEIQAHYEAIPPSDREIITTPLINLVTNPDFEEADPGDPSLPDGHDIIPAQ